MSVNDYVQSAKYENLIRNAFDCPRGTRNGADLSYMQNAMTMERGETFAKHLGSYEKQFEKVRAYISKALLKLAKTKPFSKESDYFISLDNELPYLSSTTQLMRIVESAMDKVIKTKNQ